MLPYLAQVVLAARAHGIAVLDGTFNDLDDKIALRAECDQGRDLGMDGKTLIHPTQVAVANEAFAPSKEEIVWARKVIERMLHNQDAVLKHLGKVNYGNILVRLEHHSAIFNICQGWVATRGTEIWLRHSAEDTGGTNDSSIVYKGYCHRVKPPETHGDDDTAAFEFSLALFAIVWAAAA